MQERRKEIQENNSVEKKENQKKGETEGNELKQKRIKTNDKYDCGD